MNKVYDDTKRSSNLYNFWFPKRMSTPAKAATKKGKKKPVPVKTSLDSPYTIQWSPLAREQKHLILKTLQVKLSEVGLQKQRVNRFREWGSRRKSRKKTPKPTEDIKPALKPAESVQTPSKPTEPCWSSPAVRKQLAIGINEVTKGLERNELSLVLVPKLSETLAEQLGLKCVLALGFKRGTEVFEDVVRTITPVVPPLIVSWIPTDSEEKPKTTPKRQKRKLETSDEASDASPVILQPLKVKKIIPNPKKIRKPKMKRKGAL
ncbi:hypothetical protein QQF64_010159 [Cirrhinus molitorella]|uniref:Uncharacterized protein n=1 Tax=Cirrhinus molitorella TaxID=172907 RepID=A0ABR3M370_9TELE